MTLILWMERYPVNSSRKRTIRENASVKTKALGSKNSVISSVSTTSSRNNAHRPLVKGMLSTMPQMQDRARSRHISFKTCTARSLLSAPRARKIPVSLDRCRKNRPAAYREKTMHPMAVRTKIIITCFRLSPPSGKTVRIVGEYIMEI